jgi:hypothetical protein
MILLNLKLSSAYSCDWLETRLGSVRWRDTDESEEAEEPSTQQQAGRSQRAHCERTVSPR